MSKYSIAYLMRNTKANLIEIIRCLEHNYEAEKERNQRQYEMLCKCKKYAWHDLRKNSDDLPKRCGVHMVYRPNGEYARYSLCYCGGDGTWYDNYHHDEDRRLGLNDVVAWREIEPFESEVE